MHYFISKCIGYSKLEKQKQKYSQKSVKKDKYYIYISKYEKQNRFNHGRLGEAFMR